MKIWRHTWLDILLFLFSVLQLSIVIFLANHWDLFSWKGKLCAYACMVFMITYNIIIVSHLFTHTPWFVSKYLNRLVSMLNTVNIGQSVTIYYLKHIKNHHKHNNDQKDINGKTKDLSSTFQNGKNNQHESLFRYAFLGAVSTLWSTLSELVFSTGRLWKIGKNETTLSQLFSKTPKKREEEVNQLQLDRIILFSSFVLFLNISWSWVLCCLIPALYFSFLLVNIQNYYEHYGANPLDSKANSASYYGKIYNFLTFNDGYHQEHHLRYGQHWTTMPAVRREFLSGSNSDKRIISPVPAILGFLDRKRNLLHLNNIKEESQ